MPILIKYGGNAMTDSTLQRACAADLVALQRAGHAPVLVHGGGPQIDACLQRLNLESRFHQGLRVTDGATLQAVQWVLAGEVQPLLVSLINQSGGQAVGLNGNDGLLIEAEAEVLDDGFDLGQVGRVKTVNPALIQHLLKAGMIPVVSSFASDLSGRGYNLNADAVAAALAIALKAEKVVLMTNIPGILDGADQLLPRLNAQEIARLIDSGVIKGGMIPKVAAALAMTTAGVKAVQIVDGRHPGILQQALTASPGTTITTT